MYCSSSPALGLVLLSWVITAAGVPMAPQECGVGLGQARVLGVGGVERVRGRLDLCGRRLLRRLRREAPVLRSAQPTNDVIGYAYGSIWNTRSEHSVD